MQTLSSNYVVELINARQAHSILEEISNLELDLDEGMIVKNAGDFIHGADAMHFLALLSTNVGVVRRVSNWVFASSTRARVLYPRLRAGRNLVLRLLGRKKLNQSN